MRFSVTAVQGALVIDADRQSDDRGFFVRTFCVDEFAAAGISDTFPQSNLSHNDRRATLRGMHGETPPSAESKVVRCTVGVIHDVVVDLRPESPTFLRSAAVELSRTNGRALYIPPGCAHGFVTLVDDTDVEYLMGARYRPGAGVGFRWDDPAFAIDWPIEPLVISERDRTYADFDQSAWSALRR